MKHFQETKVDLDKNVNNFTRSLNNTSIISDMKYCYLSLGQLQLKSHENLPDIFYAGCLSIAWKHEDGHITTPPSTPFIYVCLRKGQTKEINKVKLCKKTNLNHHPWIANP